LGRENAGHSQPIRRRQWPAGPLGRMGLEGHVGVPGRYPQSPIASDPADETEPAFGLGWSDRAPTRGVNRELRRRRVFALYSPLIRAAPAVAQRALQRGFGADPPCGTPRFYRENTAFHRVFTVKTPVFCVAVYLRFSKGLSRISRRIRAHEVRNCPILKDLRDCHGASRWICGK
jgi:hypothetical protein